nr:hypothetical protein [Stutzerimonas stutzeri]
MKAHQHHAALIQELPDRSKDAVLMRGIEHRRGLIEMQYLLGAARPQLHKYPSQIHALLFGSR